MNRDQYNVKREQHQHVVVAAMQASIHGVTLAQRGRNDEHWPHGVVAEEDRMEAITQALRRSEMGN
jgi:coenzyme F420-reducing hydrogenase delta subunit